MRTALQAAAFVLMLLLLAPEAAFLVTGGGWDRLFTRPGWTNGLFAQAFFVLGLPGLAAAVEFARHGGTPIPFDPPRSLVRTGPYAYLANPMQFSMALVLFAWGAWLESWWVASSAAVAVVYGAGFAKWSEAQDLEKRFGADWIRYRKSVRDWFPRKRPYIEQPATLYVAGGCGRCSQVRRWFERRGPIGLVILDAECHPTRDLERITYAGDGAEEQGVAALARALEHIHLGWAVGGWAMRLPVVVQLLQLLVDASGGEAMLVRRGAPISCNLPPLPASNRRSDPRHL